MWAKYWSKGGNTRIISVPGNQSWFPGTFFMEKVGTMASIVLKNIDVTFKNKAQTVNAVKNVSLEVEQGDIYGIIGYSGAGKSTLVRVINLLQRPTNGTVIVENQELTKLKPQELRQVRKKIGMIFQHFNLMKSRTVAGNIAYPLLATGLSKAEINAKVTHLLELVDLSEYRDAYPGQLSGGQKQRVAIARALANDPQVLISDEATSALDPKTTKSILELLKKVNEQLKITIVLITHEMQVVKEICHNVAVMEQGQIIERGPVREVFINPKTALAKDFIETSVNIKKALERIEAKNSEWSSEKRLFLLQFAGEETEDGAISRISKQTGVDISILFADMDELDGITIGYTIIKVSGEKAAIEVAYKSFKAAKIKVETLKWGG